MTAYQKIELKRKARSYNGKSFRYAESSMWASRNHHTSINDIYEALMSVRGLTVVS